MADAPITPAPAAVEQPVAAPSDTNYLPPPTMQSVAPANLTEAGSAAYGEPGAAAQPSTVVPAGAPAPAQPAPATQPGFFGRHQVLARMVTGLAAGLSAAGAAASTGGREGGVPQIQQQRLQAQAAATQQKAAEQDYAIKTQTLNQMNAANKLNLMTFNDEVAQRHMAAASAQIKTESEAQEVFDTTGRVPTGWYADPTTAQIKQGTQPPVAAPGTPGAAAPGTSVDTPFQRRLNTMLDAFDKELKDDKGNSDPSVQAARQVIADPNSNPSQKQQAIIGLQQKAGMNAQVMKNLTEKADLAAKQQTVSAGARPKDLDDATGRVTAAQLAYKNSPSPTTKTALDNAKNAQSEFMRVDKEKKQAAQDIQNGDPTVIGDMLANGTAAPSQVQSARSMSKPFYAQVLARANATAKANGAPEVIGPNGKPTGQYFNEATAESQYQYSKNVQTQNTLNKIRTLNEPGGDLDILKDATAALPKMDQKTLNKIFNASATEFGSPEATNYHTALYNLAGLLAQVQTGGIPTEGEIQAQLNLMSAANSKGQLDGQIQIARKDIAARGTSMVAKNPFLRNAYPDLVQTNQSAAIPAPQGSPASKLHANLSDFKQTTPTKEHGNLYTDDGKTWYRHDGSIYGGK